MLNMYPLKNKRLGLLQIHLAVLLFGFAGLFGKFVKTNAANITFGRTLFAAVALFMGLIFSNTSFSIQSRKDVFTLFLSGMILAVHWFTFFQSIQVSSVAIGLLSFSTFPLFVTFLEPYFFDEKLECFNVVIAILVVIGLVLVIPKFDVSHHVTQGIIWGVLSGLTFACLALLNRMHVGRYKPSIIAFYQHTFATLVNVPIVIFYSVHPSTHDIVLLLVLGVLCTALAQVLYIGSLKHIKAQLASITTGLEPVYAIIFATLLLHEVPTPRTFLGGLIILSAVFTSMFRKIKVKEPAS